jgi:hypothetical protein
MFLSHISLVLCGLEGYTIIDNSNTKLLTIAKLKWTCCKGEDQTPVGYSGVNGYLLSNVKSSECWNIKICYDYDLYSVQHKELKSDFQI